MLEADTIKSQILCFDGKQDVTLSVASTEITPTHGLIEVTNSYGNNVAATLDNTNTLPENAVIVVYYKTGTESYTLTVADRVLECGQAAMFVQVKVSSTPYTYVWSPVINMPPAA